MMDQREQFNLWDTAADLIREVQRVRKYKTKNPAFVHKPRITSVEPPEARDTPFSGILREYHGCCH